MTGDRTGTLSWKAWDVRELRGRRGRIEIVDLSTGRGGHLLVDHILLTDLLFAEPADRADWVDRGMDFMADQLADGRRVRLLTVVDVCTRECVAIEVGPRLRGEDVVRVLTQAAAVRGAMTCPLIQYHVILSRAVIVCVVVSPSRRASGIAASSVDDAHCSPAATV